MAKVIGLFCLLCWPLHLLASPPMRIVTLTPHLTELLFTIGAGNRIVATDDASDFPTEANKLPKVANYRSINLEALLAQKPDLVVAWRSAQSRMLAPIEQLGIPVFYSEPTDFGSLATEMRALGTLLGIEKQANSQADSFMAKLQDLKSRYSHPTGVTVFYQLWYPPLSSVSHIAWPAQAIELCGGSNVMASATTPYPQVNLEQVIKANPALILAGSNDPAALAHWQQWPQLEAVRKQHLQLINPDELHRFTPRALHAIEQICQTIATLAKD